MKYRKYCDFLHLKKETSTWDYKISILSDFTFNSRPLNIGNTLISSFYKTGTQLRTQKYRTFLIFILNSRPLNIENTLISSIYKTGPQLRTQIYTNFLNFILNYRPLNVENTLISSIYKTGPQLRTQKYTNYMIFILYSRPLNVKIPWFPPFSNRDFSWGLKNTQIF